MIVLSEISFHVIIFFDKLDCHLYSGDFLLHTFNRGVSLVYIFSFGIPCTLRFASLFNDLLVSGPSALAILPSILCSQESVYSASSIPACSSIRGTAYRRRAPCWQTMTRGLSKNKYPFYDCYKRYYIVVIRHIIRNISCNIEMLICPDNDYQKTR